MSTVIEGTVNPATLPAAPSRNPLASYLLEAKYEFLRVLRTPAFAVPTLLFPPMFYLLFGLVLNHGSGNAAHYLFATYSVFGVMAPGLFGFGIGVAIERERGWLALKRVAKEDDRSLSDWIVTTLTEVIASRDRERSGRRRQ